MALSAVAQHLRYTASNEHFGKLDTRLYALANRRNGVTVAQAIEDRKVLDWASTFDVDDVRRLVRSRFTTMKRVGLVESERAGAVTTWTAA